jgi:probable rRNA maturation factor
MDELRPGGQDKPSEPGVLGDVIICPQVAARQAEQAGHGTQDEIDLLCTHGILHLLGYDHAEPEEHKEMFGLQGDILASWRRHLDEDARRDSAGEEPAR